jgi:pyruvate,water dikinase
MIDALSAELAHCLKPDVCYAVRSSANVEDSFGTSFAGQFKTALNVKGVDQVMQAIWSIWASAQSVLVEGYKEKSKTGSKALKMAVIIQNMVQPVVSGVAFSKNPTNGADEVVVEGVEGMGTALVQEGTTPFRWTYKQSQWIVNPDRKILPQPVIDSILKSTTQIARLFKNPVDLEWVYDGNQVHWVQLRPITSLNQVNVYSNKISREQMPGQIKPLIWSINVPLVTGEWIRLLTEFIGKNDLTPELMVKQFYFRAYYNMGVFAQIFESLGLPSQSLEMMMGMGRSKQEKPSMRMTPKMFPLLPRIAQFLWKKLSLAPELDRNIPVLEDHLSAIICSSEELTDCEHALDRINDLSQLLKKIAYYNIIVPLTASLSNRVLEYQIKKRGKEPSHLKIPEIEQSPYHQVVGKGIDSLHRKFLQLDQSLRESLTSASYEDFRSMPGIDEFRSEFDRFLQQFGYLTESTTNFSTPAWKEQPASVLRMVIDHKLPVTRPGEFDIQSVAFPFGFKWMIMKLYKETMRLRVYRERVGDLFTRGYAIYKDLFLFIGSDFVQRGWVDEAEDIFYLFVDEIIEVIRHSQGTGELREKVEQRKREMEACQSFILPDVIYGEKPPIVSHTVTAMMTGVPTSCGYHTAKVKVIRSIREFEKLGKGEILIVPYTDISWTSLFARAGGVISESGGLLSHSSIIAREYQIPAIVSVAGATAIPDDTLVTMDGYRGEISIHSEN